MQDFFDHIQIRISDKIFIKDPESTDLGRLIIKSSIELIDELGIEAFTFKKLGQRMGSPESTLYRYFVNKQRILLYLISWYWGWLEYRLVFACANIESKEEKLSKAVRLLTTAIEEDTNIAHINEVILSRIVFSESFKVYHIKEVDAENKEGIYKPYKRLVQRVSDMILAINPEFKFPHMLVSTVIEGAHHQLFFAEHIPALTDVQKDQEDFSNFYVDMVLATIQRGR